MPSSHPARDEVFDAFESSVIHEPEYWLDRWDGMEVVAACVLKKCGALIVFMQSRIDPPLIPNKT